MSQFTASVNMFIEPAQKANVLAALSKIEEIQEVYEVAGEYDVVSIVSTPCVEEFHELMHKQILRIKGVKSTVITVILNCMTPANQERQIIQSSDERKDM